MEPVIYNEGSESSNSETLEGRPKLRNLLLRLKMVVVQNLWVYQMDRLSRNDVVSFPNKIKPLKHNVTLHGTRKNKYKLDNPNDKLIFTILEAISEYDNSIRIERLRRGKLTKVRNGGWRGGETPFKRENIGGMLRNLILKKKMVKKICVKMYSKVFQFMKLRKAWVEMILSRRGNIIWSDQSVRSILTNTSTGRVLDV